VKTVPRRLRPGVFALFLAAACFHTVSRGQDADAGVVVTKVVIVRHAEKDTVGPNPHLTPAGRKRAARLARMLADEPVGLLVSSDRARTIETLGPLAELKHLDILTVPAAGGAPAHARALADTIRAHPGGTIVVSNHSNVIPLILKELGAEGEFTVPDDEYDRIFILFLGGSGKTTLFRMRFEM